MFKLISFLTAAVWLSSAAAQISNIVAEAKQPVEETAADTASSQCQTAKKALNLDYNEDDEPDTSKLTLNYYSETMNQTYNLSDAATLILESDWLDPDETLYIYMHGFTDDPSGPSFQTIKSALQSLGNVNILALDASSLIRSMYLQSSTYVVFIGEKLGEVLASMVQAGFDASSIHLIGHSLGAHISGYAANTFFNRTGLKVGRLSGLDPAGPCFGDLPENATLNSEAADFVDVCHTNAGVLGIDRQVGHVDYWPNGGSVQPDCLEQTCSHSRAWEYFAESVMVTPDAFLGVSCADWEAFKNGTCNYTDTSYMGFDCQPGTTGTYFLQTNGESPYGRGEQGVNFVNNTLTT